MYQHFILLAVNKVGVVARLQVNPEHVADTQFLQQLQAGVDGDERLPCKISFKYDSGRSLSPDEMVCGDAQWCENLPAGLSPE